MTRSISLLLRANEGALLRVIGTVERRGYALTAVNTRAHDGDDVWRVDLDLAEGARELVHLRRQLEKLYDVIAVDPATQTATTT